MIEFVGYVYRLFPLKITTYYWFFLYVHILLIQSAFHYIFLSRNYLDMLKLIGREIECWIYTYYIYINQAVSE